MLYKVIALIIVLTLTGFLPAQESMSIKKCDFSTEMNNEYGAVVLNQRIVFCTDKQTYGNIQYTSTNGNPFFDFEEVDQFDSLKRVKSLKIEEPFNSRYSEGNITLDSAGSIAIFTRTYFPVNKRGKNKGEATLTLYQSERKNRLWSTPEPIFFPEEGQIYAQPSLAPDGKSMLLITNLNNNQDADIYYSEKLDSGWSTPTPISGPINTSSKELFPFLNSNGDIYFSSDRKESMGGLDIFVARKNGSTYRTPVALAAPINSSFNDYCFFKDSATSTVYFSSNRDGTDDVFQSYSPEITINCSPIPEKERCFVFYEDNLDPVALDSVPMKFQWDVGDGTVYDGLEADHCFKDTGYYMISLNIIDTLLNEIFYSEAVFPFDLKDQKAIYLEIPDTIKVNETVQLKFPYYTIDKQDSIVPLWDFDNGITSTGNKSKVKYDNPGTYELKASYGSGNTGVCNFKKIVVIKEEDL